ncbi:hypothetical protein [Methylobacterium sp. J-068]|nr:hypothetical protein [Methylobacterium sp. J-068]MCJ2033065.1 hypothetical protein [Methylobacterium sp. J-068]
MHMTPPLLHPNPFRTMIRQQPILAIDLILCAVLAVSVVGLLFVAL